MVSILQLPPSKMNDQAYPSAGKDGLCLHWYWDSMVDAWGNYAVMQHDTGYGTLFLVLSLVLVPVPSTTASFSGMGLFRLTPRWCSCMSRKRITSNT